MAALREVMYLTLRMYLCMCVCVRVKATALGANKTLCASIRAQQLLATSSSGQRDDDQRLHICSVSRIMPYTHTHIYISVCCILLHIYHSNKSHTPNSASSTSRLQLHGSLHFTCWHALPPASISARSVLGPRCMLQFTCFLIHFSVRSSIYDGVRIAYIIHNLINSKIKIHILFSTCLLLIRLRLPPLSRTLLIYGASIFDAIKYRLFAVFRIFINCNVALRAVLHLTGDLCQR